MVSSATPNWRYRCPALAHLRVKHLIQTLVSLRLVLFGDCSIEKKTKKYHNLQLLSRTDFFSILVSGVSYAGPYRTLIFFFRSIIFQSVLSSLLVLQCKAWQGLKKTTNSPNGFDTKITNKTTTDNTSSIHSHFSSR